MRVFLLALAVAGLLGAQERFAGSEAIDSVLEEAVLADLISDLAVARRDAREGSRRAVRSPVGP